MGHVAGGFSFLFQISLKQYLQKEKKFSFIKSFYKYLSQVGFLGCIENNLECIN